MNNTKEPAYPLTIGPQEQFAKPHYWPGMTKREAFVMAAMQGALANHELTAMPPDMLVEYIVTTAGRVMATMDAK